MIEVSGIGLVLLALLAATFIWWLVRLVECCTTSESAWRAIDQSRLVYVLLMIFLGVIGTFVYAAGPRQRLLAARAGSFR